MGPTVTDLGAGVVRVTMPLPWALDHVHCYLIVDRGGWTIVDCGLGTRSTLGWWQQVLEDLGSPRVQRIVITHYHPDHVGAAAGLARLTAAEEVVQGALDARLTLKAWGADADAEAFAAYLRHHGMPAELARASTAAEEATPVEPAQPTRLVEPGDTIEMAGESFRVLLLPGHADGHIALYGPRSGRLFSADVLLAEITPNVGRWPDTAPDPLNAYLDTLRRVSALAPSLVYPGHGPPIEEAAGRAQEIREHHVERLDVHARALSDGAQSAFEVAQLVWAADGLGFHEQRFALVEAISHLERLQALGRATQHAPARWRPCSNRV